tara:strand:- start:534 stop:680 length:147 start_codon:yes stop_codon:yes gene_type:complete
MINDKLILTNKYFYKKVKPKDIKFKPTNLSKLFSMCPKGKKVCKCKKI